MAYVDKRVKRALLIALLVVVAMAVADRYAKGQGGEGPSGSFGHIITNDGGAPLPQRQILDFGTGVDCTDNIGNLKTECVGSGGGGGHEIRDSGQTLTQRLGLQFLGDTVVTDDAGGDQTVVTITPPAVNPATDHSAFDADVAANLDVATNTAKRHDIFAADNDTVVDHVNFDANVAATPSVSSNTGLAHPVFVPEVNTADDHSNFATEVATLTSHPGSLGEVFTNDGANGPTASSELSYDGAGDLSVTDATTGGIISTSHATLPLQIVNHLAGGVDLQSGATINGDPICFDAGSGCGPPTSVLGTWSSVNNNPSLTDGCNGPGGPYVPGQYYIVSDQGFTVLDGNGTWLPGDWAICSSQTLWSRIANVTNAAGTEGQIQVNHTGALGAFGSGAPGELLSSQGSGSDPTWVAPFAPDNDTVVNHINFDDNVTNATEVLLNSGLRHSIFSPNATTNVNHANFPAEVLAIADVKSIEDTGTVVPGGMVCWQDANGKTVRACIPEEGALLRGEVGSPLTNPALGPIPFSDAVASLGTLPPTLEAGGVIRINRAGVYKFASAIGFVANSTSDCREWAWYIDATTETSNIGFGGNSPTGGQASIASFQPLADGFASLTVGQSLTVDSAACPAVQLGTVGDITEKSSFFEIELVVDSDGGGGGAAPPIGPEKSIQTMSGGALLGFADFTFDDATNCLALATDGSLCMTTDLTVSNAGAGVVKVEDIDFGGDNAIRSSSATAASALTIANDFASGVVTIEDIDFGGDNAIRSSSATAASALTIANDFASGVVAIEDIEFAGNASIVLPLSAAQQTLSIYNASANGDVNVEGTVFSNNDAAVNGRLTVLGATATLPDTTRVGKFIVDDDGAGMPPLTTTALHGAGTNLHGSAGYPLTACTVGEAGQTHDSAKSDAFNGQWRCGEDTYWHKVDMQKPGMLFMPSMDTGVTTYPAGTWLSVGATDTSSFVTAYFERASNIFARTNNIDDRVGADGVGERWTYNGVLQSYFVTAQCDVDTPNDLDGNTRMIQIEVIGSFGRTWSNSLLVPAGSAGFNTSQIVIQGRALLAPGAVIQIRLTANAAAQPDFNMTANCDVYFDAVEGAFQ